MSLTGASGAVEEMEMTVFLKCIEGGRLKDLREEESRLVGPAFESLKNRELLQQLIREIASDVAYCTNGGSVWDDETEVGIQKAINDALKAVVRWADEHDDELPF
jgi:hypothetical protein